MNTFRLEINRKIDTIRNIGGTHWYLYNSAFEWNVRKRNRIRSITRNDAAKKGVLAEKIINQKIFAIAESWNELRMW